MAVSCTRQLSSVAEEETATFTDSSRLTDNASLIEAASDPAVNLVRRRFDERNVITEPRSLDISGFSKKFEEIPEDEEENDERCKTSSFQISFDVDNSEEVNQLRGDAVVQRDRFHCTCISSGDKDCVLRSFNSLPNEIKVHIFSYLSLTERAKCAQVCRTWYQVTRITSLWREIDLLTLPLCLGGCYRLARNTTALSRPLTCTDNVEDRSVINDSADVAILHSEGYCGELACGKSEIIPDDLYFDSSDSCKTQVDDYSTVVKEPNGIGQALSMSLPISEIQDLFANVHFSDDEAPTGPSLNAKSQPSAEDLLSSVFHTRYRVTGNHESFSLNISDNVQHCCEAKDIAEELSYRTTEAQLEHPQVNVEVECTEQVNDISSRGLRNVGNSSRDSNEEVRLERDALLCYKLYCQRVDGFLCYLSTVIRPSVQVLRVALNIGDTREQWQSSLSQLLRSCHLRSLHSVNFFWDSDTSPDKDDDDSSADVIHRHRMAQRQFISLFEILVRQAPRIRRLCLPFDWSTRSLNYLCRLQYLHTLILHRCHHLSTYFELSLERVIAALPVLRRLNLEMWVASGRGVTLVNVSSSSLQWLDMSRCRGVYVNRVQLPAAVVVKLSRSPVYSRGLLLPRAANLDAGDVDATDAPDTEHSACREFLHKRNGDDGGSGRIYNPANKYPCVYDLLRNGSRRLQRLNEHILRRDWKECCYTELDLVLSSVCLCCFHSKPGLAEWTV